jgi:tetratricopeptide (TPR) repeat protein
MLGKTSVFISYARKDAKEFAKKLYIDLKDHVDVWFDLQSMPSGDTFITALDRAIQDTNYFILVFTPGAIASEFCRDEWKKALEHYKPIIPLLYIGDYADLPEEANINQNDARDFREADNYRHELERLLDQVKIMPRAAGKLYGAPDVPRNYLPRPQELDDLRHLLTAHKTTVLTSVSKKIGMQGMGGIGKSVLATALTRDYFVRRAFPDGVFWLTFGTEPFLGMIWERLRGWLGGGGAIFANGTEAADFFEQATADKECLIILDDLWQSDHAKAFARLGDRSRLLVTSRHASVLTEMDAHPYELGLLSESEARTLLAQTAEVSESELSSTADGIILICDNLPLALAMVGAMVRNKPQTYWHDALEALQTADLEDISIKFPDYPYPSLFAAIAVSVRALDDDLCQSYYDFAIFPDDISIPEGVMVIFWKPITGRQVRKKLDELVNRNLLKRAADGTLTIHDLQLAYVRKQVDDLLARHQRLLENYNPGDKQSWWEIEPDGYIYEQLAHHLLATGQADRLHYLLTGSSDWMQAKFSACGGDNAYVNDLQRALQGYHDPLTRNQVLRVIELFTARQVINHRVERYNDTMLKALVWLGRCTEAIGHARLRPDTWHRFKGLLTVYAVLLEQPHPTIRAATLHDELRQTALTIGDAENRSWSLIHLAIALAQAGEEETAHLVFAEAQTVANSIDDASEQVRVLCALATALVQAGERETVQQVFNEAQMMAISIDNTENRGYAFCNLATTLAKSGDFQQAQAIVTSIDDAVAKSKALSALATALVQAGEEETAHQVFNEAQAIATSIDDASRRVWALSALATALAESRDFEQAQVVINSIDDALYCVEAINNLATALAKSGDFQQAQAVINSIDNIDDASARKWALSNLATSLAKSGDFLQAQAVVATIESDWSRAEALSELVTVLAQAGDMKNAQQIFTKVQALVTTVDDIHYRAGTLSALATVLARAGKRETAHHVFTEAQMVANSIDHASSRVVALSALATTLAKSGDFQQAQAVATSIDDASTKSRALSDLAIILVQADEEETAHQVFTEAQMVANSIDHASRRVWALSDLATALTRAGEEETAHQVFTEAQAIATSIDDASTKSRVFSDLATALARAGEREIAHQVFAEAQTIATSIDDASAKSRALSDLATALAESGDFPQAQSVITTIDNTRYRAEALRTLVVALAERGDFLQAQSVITTIDDTYVRAWALSNLASSLTERGDFLQAQSVITTIDNGGNRAEALRTMVVALAERGDFLQAQSVITTIDYIFYRKAALRALAANLAQAGQVFWALSVLDQYNLDVFVHTLIDWQPHFDRLFTAGSSETPLSLDVLRRALQICAWEIATWQKMIALWPESNN